MDKPDYPAPTGYLLLQTSQQFEDRFTEALLGSGISGIGLPQLKLLQHLGADGLSQARLADRSGLSKQGVNKSIGELIRKGYVELRPDQRDGRARRVCLTPAGTALMRRVAGLVKEIELDYHHRLGEHYHLLRRVLGQLLA